MIPGIRMKGSNMRDMIYLTGNFQYAEQNDIDDLVRIFFDNEVIVIERAKLKKLTYSND